MVLARVREFFLLEQAERAVASLPASRRAEMLAYVEAGERRIAAAPSLADPRTAVAAAILLHDGVRLLLRGAALASNVVEAGEEGEASPARALGWLFANEAAVPAPWVEALGAFSHAGPLFLDRMSGADLGALGRSLQDIASAARARIETRSTTNLRGARYGRLAAIALLALYAAFALGDRIYSHFRPNLALHRSVTVSSAWPGSVPASALVDGEHAGRAGPEVADSDIVHTNREASPWAVIDLGAVHTLHEVRVYNRMDHSFDDGLPYSVELSTDGNDFHLVGRRTVHFGGGRFDPPWRLSLGGATARFVRIRSTQYLALSEVEVY